MEIRSEMCYNIVIIYVLNESASYERIYNAFLH